MPKHLYIENRHLCRIFSGSLPDLFCPFRVPKAVATTLTSNARRASKVPYPNAYASAAEAAASPAKARFNCAQRAHANFTENHATFLVNLLVAGLRFPNVSAFLGATWVVGRLVYTFGYVREGREDGSGRLEGVWWWLPHLALMGMAVVAAAGEVC